MHEKGLITAINKDFDLFHNKTEYASNALLQIFMLNNYQNCREVEKLLAAFVKELKNTSTKNRSAIQNKEK